MKRALVSAYIGSHNLGDEAIASVLINKLKSVSDLELTVLSIDPEKTMKMVPGVRVELARLGNFFRSIRRSDMLILGGGGIIQDESSVVNLLYYYLQTFVAARMYKKKVYLLFVGVGPIKSRPGHLMMKMMIPLLRYAVVRDEASRDVLVSYGMPGGTVGVARDIVFNVDVSSASSRGAKKKVFPSQKNEQTIIFSPRDWFFSRTYLPAKVSRALARRGLSSDLYLFRQSLLGVVTGILRHDPLRRVVGVPFFATQDRDLLEWIEERLDPLLKPRFTLPREPVTLKSFLNTVTQADAVIGMRLHSIILAAAAGARVVPMIYSSKVEAVAEHLGVSHLATDLQHPRMDPEIVADRLEMALNSRVSFEDELTTTRRANEEEFEIFARVIFE